MSVSSIESTESEYADLLRLTDDRCWCCGATPVRIAYVLPKAQQEVMQTYLMLRLVPFVDFSDVRNRVPLCGNCQCNFDSPTPGMIFVPSDLDFLMHWEKKDQKLREEMQTWHKVAQGRTPLDAFEYASHIRETQRSAKYGTYDIYITRDYFSKYPPRPPLKPGLFRENVQWSGSPTAAVLKAFSVMKIPIGIPLELLKKLTDLSIVWFSTEPSPAAVTGREGNGNSGTADEGLGGNTGGGGAEKRPGPSGNVGDGMEEAGDESREYGHRVVRG